MEMLPIRRALLSVTDKTGLVEFARFLRDNGVEIVSTGGTRRALVEAGLDVVSVSEVTGFPEIMNGRVKTLHPHVHGGVLADKEEPEHLATLDKLGIKTFDCVCVNLYDFADAAGRGLELKQAVEQIDIGGPTLLRAAAKNYHSVLVVPETTLYARVRAELECGEFGVGLELRREAAVRTFEITSRYDAFIAGYLRSR